MQFHAVFLYLLFTQFVPHMQTAENNLSLAFQQWLHAAESSVDLCFYQITDPVIKDSLLALHARGIQIRVIVDDDREYLLGPLVYAGIPVISDTFGGNADFTMHDKFALRDVHDGDPANDAVWVGSWNATPYLHADNATEIYSHEVAQIFLAEFNQMWGSDSLIPNPGQARFNVAKQPLWSDRQVIIGEDTLWIYFGPQDRPVDTLAAWVGRAQTSAEFLIYTFTHWGLRDSLLSLLARGGTVIGIFDSTMASSDYSQYDELLAGGAQVFIDPVPDPFYLLHHKVMILDERRLEFGSMNYTHSANTYNDEVAVFLAVGTSTPQPGNGRSVVQRYHEEFLARLAEVAPWAVQETPENGEQTWWIPAVVQDVIRLPSHGRYQIVDRVGRIVLQGEGTRISIGSLPPGVYFLRQGQRAVPFIRIP